MKTSLSFSQQGDKYKATFISTGATVVQVERDYTTNKTGGKLSVYVNIDGMSSFPLFSWSRNEATENRLFLLNIPANLTVDIISDIPVTSANILTEDA